MFAVRAHLNDKKTFKSSHHSEIKMSIGCSIGSEWKLKIICFCLLAKLAIKPVFNLFYDARDSQFTYVNSFSFISGSIKERKNRMNWGILVLTRWELRWVTCELIWIFPKSSCIDPYVFTADSTEMLIVSGKNVSQSLGGTLSPCVK